jgi:hypothetical protein
MDEGKRRGDWIQTYSGIQFWPLDPREEDILIEDIAHALSMQCRFGGHCHRFYSVAEHCCHVSDRCPEFPLWGLLHDAAEAYLTDVIRPIKPYLTEYKGIEDHLMYHIANRFGLEHDMPYNVKVADLRILTTEVGQLLGPPPQA